MTSETNPNATRVLCLGGGVQSTTALLMSLAGEAPAFHQVIFADTGWERGNTYRHLNWLMAECKNSNVPFEWLKPQKSMREHITAGVARGEKSTFHYACPPAYTYNIANGQRGRLRRTCTQELKIRPIEEFIKRKLLGLRPRQREPQQHLIDLCFGISSDEAQRVRQPTKSVRLSPTEHDIERRTGHRAPRGWLHYVYPLIGIRCRGRDVKYEHDKAMNRDDCKRWLARHGFSVPQRTACIGCPFNSDLEWSLLNDHDRADAITVDDALRASPTSSTHLYLHRSCQPLREVFVRLKPDYHEDEGSVRQDECCGVCDV